MKLIYLLKFIIILMIFFKIIIVSILIDLYGDNSKLNQLTVQYEIITQ